MATTVIFKPSSIQQLMAAIPAGMGTEEQTLTTRLTEVEDKSAAIHDEFVVLVSGIRETENSVRQELLYAAQLLRQPTRSKKRKRANSDSENESSSSEDEQETTAETYRTAATQFSKMSDVLIHLQKRLVELQDQIDDRKKRLLENHKRYKTNRDEWFAAIQKLTHLSDRIDDTCVVNLLSPQPPALSNRK